MFMPKLQRTSSKRKVIVAHREESDGFGGRSNLLNNRQGQDQTTLCTTQLTH